jgi:PAS domain S-box-containing protein
MSDPTPRQVSEARLIAMFDNQLDAVAFVDDDGCVVQGNPALAELTGITQEQLVGTGLPSLYKPSEQTAGPFEQAWQALRDRGRMRGEYEAQTPGGRSVRLEIRAVADVLPGTHFFAVREVTERHRMEMALRASERRFRTLAEYSAEGIFVQRVHPTNRFEYLNPAMARTIGYAVDELYADPDLLRNGIDEHDRARMWASLEGGGIEAGAVEVDFRRRDGQLLRLRLRGNAIRDDAGQIVAIHAVATDVTSQYRERQALREAVEQQRQLNDLKTGFVQAVSHELRTPLTSIVGFVELLLRRDLEPPEQRRYLERISAGAAKLERLIGDVLDLDRLERPETLIDRDAVDLADLVALVVADTTVTDRQVHLDLSPAATVGDRGLLERVIDNLVRNALKHTPTGANVWVRTRGPATICVEDDGPGVPQELHRRIFDPFQQGPDQLDRHAPGAGIGLSLSQRIVRLHGGEVTLSDRPGGGARFVVELPAVPT